ncbi:MAG: ExbD/TolR family protein [Chitinophagaceae bacterium]
MGRPKIARKSTNIDMTAMCDVAFLLLSFFILTTKFKPSEAITVETPNSVSSKKAPQKDVVLVTIDKTGKVFISMDDAGKKETIGNAINAAKGLNIDVKKFKAAEFFGASFASLNQFLNLPKEQLKGELLPGIPVDSTKGANELVEWLTYVKSAYEGSKMNILLKGDNLSKYPSFKAVIDAFKKNDILKLQMVTNPENAPQGTDLYVKRKQEEYSGVRTEE